jgi:hypothetical protein
MTISLYEKCLASCDWYAAWSDSYTVYRKGQDQMEQLRRMQKLYDTDYTLWNYYAPQEFKKGIINERNTKPD